MVKIDNESFKRLSRKTDHFKPVKFLKPDRFKLIVELSKLFGLTLLSPSSINNFKKTKVLQVSSS